MDHNWDNIHGREFSPCFIYRLANNANLGNSLEYCPQLIDIQEQNKPGYPLYICIYIYIYIYHTKMHHFSFMVKICHSYPAQEISWSLQTYIMYLYILFIFNRFNPHLFTVFNGIKKIAKIYNTICRHHPWNGSNTMPWINCANVKQFYSINVQKAKRRTFYTLPC